MVYEIYKQRRDVPEPGWARTGLAPVRPRYGDRVYNSIACEPTLCERFILFAHSRRPVTSGRQALLNIAGPGLAGPYTLGPSAEVIRDFIQVSFS